MRKLAIDTPARTYTITINQGMIGKIPLMISKSLPLKRWLIITDDNVSSLYLKAFEEALMDHAYVLTYCVKAGEASKSLDRAARIYDYLSEHHYTRSDGIIALGGGVVGDLAGFVASTYLRGMPWVQVPTSLLAQVDSSVGGKVAVNTQYGKNLVGSFYQPNGVYIDTAFLATLKPREMKSGLGEVIKYACIDDLNLFETLEKESLESLNWSDIVWTCLSIKKAYVEADEKELGLRKHLNFGHTLGHALEKHDDYRGLNHGEAVVEGIVFASKLSEKKDLLNIKALERILELIKRYDYNTDHEYSSKVLCDLLKNDKKNVDQGIDFILLEAIGKSKIVRLGHGMLQDYVRECYQ